MSCDTRFTASGEQPVQSALLAMLRPVLAERARALTAEERAEVDADLTVLAELAPAGSLLAQARAVAERVAPHCVDSERVLLRMHEIAGSGNLESCRSSQPMVRALYALGYDPSLADAGLPFELVIGRGHIAPTFYAEEYVRGRLPLALLATLHSGGLSGVIHRDWGFPNTMGYSLGIGVAQATSRAFWLSLQGRSTKVVCLAGDGELHEGLTFECLRFVDERELSNLVLVIDANGKGIDPLQRPLRAGDLTPFFPTVLEVDGTDTQAITCALERSLATDGRCAIVCRTAKGAHSFKPKGAPPAAPRFSQRCGQVMKTFLQQTKLEALTVTADMVDRFGLRDTVPYVNVSLSETLSVGLSLSLPSSAMKFVATDAKYFMDSLGTLVDVASTVEHMVLLAGKSWGVWGGEPTALNTFAVQNNVKVYEPITEDELFACLHRARRTPREVHVVSVMDAPIASSEVDCSGNIDEGVWLRAPRGGEGVVVTFGYAGALVRDVIGDLPLGHLHFAALRPVLGAREQRFLDNCPGVLVVEYNGLVGGLGDYLRANYLIDCASLAVTRDVVNAPHARQLEHHGMDAQALSSRLTRFAERLSSVVRPRHWRSRLALAHQAFGR